MIAAGGKITGLLYLDVLSRWSKHCGAHGCHTTPVEFLLVKVSLALPKPAQHECENWEDRDVRRCGDAVNKQRN
jgi:hypothetical protein